MSGRNQRQIDRLLKAAGELGEREITMPIDIFNLARDFADLPDSSSIFAITRKALLSHPNAFVRRVFFIMVRFMEDADLSETDLADVVLAGLADQNAWVQYDAAWLAGDRRISMPTVVERLKELARGDNPRSAIDPGDARANLRRQATKAVAAILAN